METERKEKKARKRSPLKTVLKTLFGIVLAVIVLLSAGLIALSIGEYKPNDTEAVAAPAGTRAVDTGKPLTVVTYNIGYAALGEDMDFIMDGGTKTRPDSASVIERNLKDIADTVKGLGADYLLIQEIDLNSRRSYNVDELEYLKEATGLPASFALNYSAPFVPYPFPDMLGRVNSGVAVFTDLNVKESTRIQLPVPFSWPVSTINLKRCMLVNRTPLDNGKELVIINVHLEAYDSGEGKIAQTKQLYEFMDAEAKKGNYVIVGGDFNQTFPGAKLFPAIYEGCWMPEVVEKELPEGFSFAFDAEEPTCRLLNKPYKGNDDPMYYILDGFIVSGNLRIEELEVIDTAFVSSDHRPVKLTVSFN